MENPILRYRYTWRGDDCTVWTEDCTDPNSIILLDTNTSGPSHHHPDDLDDEGNSISV